MRVAGTEQTCACQARSRHARVRHGADMRVSGTEPTAPSRYEQGRRRIPSRARQQSLRPSRAEPCCSGRRERGRALPWHGAGGTRQQHPEPRETRAGRHPPKAPHPHVADTPLG